MLLKRRTRAELQINLIEAENVMLSFSMADRRWQSAARLRRAIFAALQRLDDKLIEERFGDLNP